MCIKCSHGVFDAKKAIAQAIEDYRRHTSAVAVLDAVSDDFINRLAEDSYDAKTELRNLFRKSPVWNEQLQALVINGNRTHNPDYDLIHSWIYEILSTLKVDAETWQKINLAVNFFTTPNHDDFPKFLAALNEIAPKAYHKGRKKSKIFKAMCDALGVVDNSKGSAFQKLYAKIADELSARKIDFKLYVSINPAHFLTMSNPETLNNRKTSRQMFAYKPSNGLLLQSRMYTTNSGSSYGGVNGDTAEGKLYRDLIQREISELENAANLWRTQSYCNSGIEICAGVGFGGYADWTYSDFGAKISILNDYADDFEEFEIGTYGLCIECGSLTENGLYCEDCKYKTETCEECGVRCEETWLVHGRHGEMQVCEECLCENYVQCEHCEEYFPAEDMACVSDGSYVCEDCLCEHYSYCDNCGEYCPDDYMHRAVDSNGAEITICESCRDYSYEECEQCGSYFYSDGENLCPNCRGGEQA